MRTQVPALGVAQLQAAASKEGILEGHGSGELTPAEMSGKNKQGKARNEGFPRKQVHE